MNKILILLIVLITISSCNSEKHKSVTVTKHGGEKVYQIHMKEIKDSITTRLSDFATDFSFVKLETKEECLLRRGNTYVTSEYILIQKPQHGILQFDRQGQFVRTLVKNGKGPKEYMYVSWTVDENNQVLYMSESSKMNYFLSFDLRTGEYLGDIKKAIPGKTGHIKVTGENTLLVSRSGDIDISINPYIIYYQDFEGDFVSGISIEQERFMRTAEIMQGHERYNYQYEGRDTVFSIDNDKLKPHVIIDYGEKNHDAMVVGWKRISEDFESKDLFKFKNNYVTQVADGYVSADFDTYILNKKEQKVYLCEGIYCDPTAQTLIPIESFFTIVQDNGIVHYTYEAFDLLNQAKKALNDPDFKEPYRSQLEQVINGLSENDNPVLLIGKISK